MNNHNSVIQSARANKEYGPAGLPQLMRGLILVSLLVVVQEAIVYLLTKRAASLYILISVLEITVGAGIGLSLALRGRIFSAMAVSCGSMYISAMACVLFNPDVLTVSVMASLLGTAMAMPFATNKQVRFFALMGGINVFIIAVCGIYYPVYPSASDRVSKFALLIAVLVGSGIALNWLVIVHKRLTGLVTEVSHARDNLEEQVAQRTDQLEQELARERRLEAELQEARERLVNTLEDERRRIRRDLHDGLGPQLASLTLKLDAAKRLSSQNKATDANLTTLLDDIKNQTQSAVGDVRRLVYGLRPPVLDEMGLAGAVRHHAQQLSNTGFQVEVQIQAELPHLTAAQEVAAYRISLEALTNVQRHAHATLCTIDIHTESCPEPQYAGADCVLKLAVEDNGTGFSTDVRHGVGIRSMYERAAELGGDLHITSFSKSTGTGTCLTASLPLFDRKTREAPVHVKLSHAT